MADYQSSYTGAQIDSAVGKASKLPTTSSGDSGKTLQVDASGNIVANTVSAGMTNPMTTQGDIIIGGSSGSATRLGIGTNGQVLTSNGTTASWQTPSSSGGGSVTDEQLFLGGLLPCQIVYNSSTIILFSIPNLIYYYNTTGEQFDFTNYVYSLSDYRELRIPISTSGNYGILLMIFVQYALNIRITNGTTTVSPILNMTLDTSTGSIIFYYTDSNDQYNSVTIPLNGTYYITPNIIRLD